MEQPLYHGQGQAGRNKFGDFAAGEQNFQIAGIWGYVQFSEDSGTDLNDASLTTTKAAVAVDYCTQFHVGQTVLIGTEQMLVTGISRNNLAVTRGLNGSSAHADDSDINILRWPASVERAALVQTARIWTRSANFEPFFVDADLDTDVRLMLETYRKTAA